MNLFTLTEYSKHSLHAILPQNVCLVQLVISYIDATHAGITHCLVIRVGFVEAGLREEDSPFETKGNSYVRESRNGSLILNKLRRADERLPNIAAIHIDDVN